MQVTVSIHEAWFARPEDLRRLLALLAGLEVPPPGNGNGTAKARQAHEAYDPREDLEEPFDPEGRAPARPSRRYPGNDDRSQATADDDLDLDEDAPRDGRQLLGWARKQDPDAMGTVLSYGKRTGLKSKIVDWTPDQVHAAYRFARAVRSTTR